MARVLKQQYNLDVSNDQLIGKQWIYSHNGELTLKPNVSGEHYAWKYHVAIYIIDDDDDTWILDPSLFRCPVSAETWKNKMNDPRAHMHTTPATTYFHSDPILAGTTNIQEDPGFDQHLELLEGHRDKLEMKKAPSGDEGAPSSSTATVY